MGPACRSAAAAFEPVRTAARAFTWSAETESLEATADAPSGCWVTVAAFSPDSTRVLAAGDASCA
jgi:hypothetical protein